MKKDNKKKKSPNFGTIEKLTAKQLIALLASAPAVVKGACGTY